VSPIASPKILLTGNPGSGKTTAIRAVVESLRGRIPVTGFFTEDLREEGRRVGFRGVTLDGRDFLLAHIRNSGSARVGPYGVDLSGLETTGLESLSPRAGYLFVVDEIGKMECLSEAFKTRVAELLEGDAPLLATVAAVGVGFVKRARNHSRAKLYTIAHGEGRRMGAEITRTLLRELGDGGQRS
jgi:nucleoside-triphosphatase